MGLPKKGLTIRDIIPLISGEEEVEVLWDDEKVRSMDILKVTGHTMKLIEDSVLKSIGCGDGRIRLHLKNQ